MKEYEDIQAKCFKRIFFFHSDSHFHLLVSFMKFLLWPQKWFSFKEKSPQKKINLILATEKSSTLLILQCAFHGISVTKDDHFPVVILKLHFKST